MLDHLIRRGADDPAVTFMSRLGATGFGLIPTLLAIRRGRLRGCARGLRRPLQPQHQFDQLFLAQTLKIAATHDTRESANPSSRKALGNYIAVAKKLSFICLNYSVGISTLKEHLVSLVEAVSSDGFS